jgi:predicted transposase YbfD/YdcC
LSNSGKLIHPESVYQQQERSHGRIVQWHVSVFEQLGTFADEWAGLQRCICIERQGIRDGQAFYERQYYISSVVTTAQQFHAIIRGHWSIENCLHWVKDVTFNEDDSTQRGRFASANWSVVRNFFITIARSLGFTSIVTAKRKLANQLEMIFPLLQ